MVNILGDIIQSAVGFGYIDLWTLWSTRWELLVLHFNQGIFKISSCLMLPLKGHYYIDFIVTLVYQLAEV